MKNRIRCFISLVLVLIMVISLVPANFVYADTPGSQDDNSGQYEDGYASPDDAETTYTETTDEITEEKDTDVSPEPIPTFDTSYDGISVEGIDFSSCELLIGASDASVFTADTEVVSEYNGIYLTRYQDPEQTANAYTYYGSRADLIEVNTGIKADDTEDIPNDGHGEADLSELNNGDDAFSNVNDISVEDYSGYIALIDTGAEGSNVRKSISVIGDSVSDDNGHGTKMAEMISEANPDAKILSIKALGSDATGSISDVYAAIEYAVDSNVSVINLSMSSISTAESELLEKSVSDALAKGITVVASAGNNGKNAAYYTPGNIEGVYTIGACDKDGKKIDISNFGSSVNYYVAENTTSKAAAYFSGLVLNGIDDIDSNNKVFTRESVENATDDNNEVIDNEGYVRIVYLVGDDYDWTKITTDTWIQKNSDDGRSVWEITDDGGTLTSYAYCIDPHRKSPKVNDSTTFSNVTVTPDYYTNLLFALNIRNPWQTGSYSSWGAPQNSQIVVWTMRYAFHNWTEGNWAAVKASSYSTVPYTDTQLSTWADEYYNAYHNINNNVLLINWSTGEEVSYGIDGLEKTRTANDNYWTVKGSKSQPALSFTNSNISSDSGLWTYDSSSGMYSATTTFNGSTGQFTYLEVPSGCRYVVNGTYTYNAGETAVLWAGDTLTIYAGSGTSVTQSVQGRLTHYGTYMFTANDENQQRLMYLWQWDSPSTSLSFETPEKYYVGVAKYDAQTGDKIKGSKYDVYRSDNTNIGTIDLTNSTEGTLDISSHYNAGFTSGYYAKETKAPDGYVLNTDNVPLTVNEDTVTSFGKDYDRPRCYIRVKKEAAHSNYYNTTDYSLDGATFGLYSSSACKEADRITTLTTKTVNGTPGYTDYFDVTSKMETITDGGHLKFKATNFYIKELTASKGYKVNPDVYTVTVLGGNNNYSITATVKEWEENWVYLKKSSADTECTNNNPNYSLEGATYKVFDTEEKAQAALETKNYSNAIMTFVCDANGNTDAQNISSYMKPNASSTTFYVVESKAGNEGYIRSEAVTPISVTRDNDINHPALINVTDTPVNDPINLTVKKEDAIYGAVESLEGAEFRFSFYAVDIDTIRTAQYLKANYSPTRSFTRTTDKDGLIRITDYEFPRGFVVIDEISNPDGYSLDNLKVYLNGDKTKDITDNLVFVTDAIVSADETTYQKTTWYPNDAATYAELATKGTKYEDSTFTFTVTNAPKRGNIRLTKMASSGDKMEGVKFRITNKDTGEVHYIYTDENGFATTKTDSYDDKTNYYDTVTEYDKTVSTVWFKQFKDKDGDIKEADPADGYEALPLGTYEVKEMTCKANKGKQLEPAKTIVIDENNYTRIIDVFDENATDSENAIWNEVKPTIGTTAIVEDTDSKTLGQSQIDSDYDWTNQTIIDTCRFDKLRADTDYTILTELMIVDQDGAVTPYLDKDGKPYKRIANIKTPAEYKKSIYEISDTIDIELDKIDPTGLEEQQKKLVVYESLFYGKYDTVADVDAAIENNTYKTRYEDYDENDDMDFFPVEHKDKDDDYQTVKPGDIHTTIKDSVSEDRIAHTSKETTLIDSVFYTGLTVGKEYTVEGTLQAKEGTDWSTITYDPLNPEADSDGYVYSTEPDDTMEYPNKAYTFRDADGNPVTASKTFIAEKSEGYIDLEFTFDSSLLEGKSCVAFEKLKYKDIVISAHTEISDEDETVHFPKFKTTTRNSELSVSGDESSKEIPALAEKSTFTDTIHFHNLLANRTYIAKGTLMNKATGEALKDANGKVIYAEKIFTTDDVDSLEITESPSAFNFTTEDGTLLDMSADYANYLCDGDVDVVFEGYDFTNLADTVGVVYEELYLIKETYDDKGIAVKKEVPVGEHKDIKDVDQFIYFIDIHTNATDKETGIPVVPQDKETTILDTVTYSNVIIGKTYKLTASLKVVNDESGKYKDGDNLLDKNGKPVTVDFEFTPKNTSGEAVVEIPFDTTNLRDMDIVVFEDMYNSLGLKVAAHNDLKDREQTVRVPGGGTTAYDKATKDSVAQADKNIALVDTVSYKNLEPGKEYSVTGTVYVKETNKPLQVNGKDLTKTVKFTPSEPDGTVDVEFEINTRDLRGKTLVVFEDVSYKGISVFVHADIDDEGQTVYIPEIGTTATADGAKTVRASKTVTIIDKVEYTNLVPGKEYKICGSLWNKSTTEKLLINGKNITAEKTFTPAEPNGYVELSFTFDASGLSGGVVVGEQMYHNDIEVATHIDLTDEGQTVTITPPEKTPKTGDSIPIILIIGLLVAAAGGIVAIIAVKRNKKN